MSDQSENKRFCVFSDELFSASLHNSRESAALVVIEQHLTTVVTVVASHTTTTFSYESHQIRVG